MKDGPIRDLVDVVWFAVRPSERLVGECLACDHALELHVRRLRSRSARHASPWMPCRKEGCECAVPEISELRFEHYRPPWKLSKRARSELENGASP